MSERTLLLQSSAEKKYHYTSGLSVIFAIICIVDVFGVFPITTLSKSVIDCGMEGIFVIILVCSAQIYTAILLGRCWLIAEEIDPTIEDKNRYPYSALAEMTFGSKFSKLVTFLLDVTIFSGGIPNLIVASQTLQLLGSRVTANEFTLSFCYWIVILGIVLCPFLWLGSPKDMKLICVISVTMVIAVFVLILGCIIFDTEATFIEEVNKTHTTWENEVRAYGIIAFQFDIHPTILTIQVDMIDKTKIAKAVIGGFSVSLAMFALTATSAFFRYGRGTLPSLLGNLPSSIALHFSSLLVALQLVLTCVVSNSALYQHMEDCLQISRVFNHKRCILRTLLTILAIILAESVPRLDVVMSLIGGTFIGPLVFIFPPLIFMKISHMKRAHAEMLQLQTFQNTVYNAGTSELSLNEEDFTVVRSRMLDNLEYAFCAFIVLLGIVGTISTTYLNVGDTIQYATFSQPCIYNLTFVSPF